MTLKQFCGISEKLGKNLRVKLKNGYQSPAFEMIVHFSASNLSQSEVYEERLTNVNMYLSA